MSDTSIFAESFRSNPQVAKNTFDFLHLYKKCGSQTWKKLHFDRKCILELQNVHKTTYFCNKLSSLM